MRDLLCWGIKQAKQFHQPVWHLPHRRFLPIKVNQVDIKGLIANRDKLWAEAVYYYKQGEEYWLSQALAKQANQQANERLENDPWVEMVQGLPSDIAHEDYTF